MLSDILAYNWKITMFRGALAVLLGCLMLVAPAQTFMLVVLLFGAYCIVDGISSIANGVRRRRNEQAYGAPIAFGLMMIAAGIITLALPGVTAFVLAIIVAATLMARGFFEIGAAITLRHEIRGEVWLAFAGLVSVVFGGWMISSPLRAATGIIAILTVYAFVYGISILGLGFRLRKVSREVSVKFEDRRRAA